MYQPILFIGLRCVGRCCPSKQPSISKKKKQQQKKNVYRNQQPCDAKCCCKLAYNDANRSFSSFFAHVIAVGNEDLYRMRGFTAEQSCTRCASQPSISERMHAYQTHAPCAPYVLYYSHFLSDFSFRVWKVLPIFAPHDGDEEENSDSFVFVFRTSPRLSLVGLRGRGNEGVVMLKMSAKKKK